MSEVTKGEWISKSNMVYVDDENGYVILANVGGLNGSELSNATLMAASKDLLEACEATLDAQTRKEVEAAKRMCLSAIQKAKSIK